MFVHELGHFWVARRNNIKVEEFAFGLPLLPRIFSRKRGETEYSIYPVPLGGFVRMLGEDGDSQDKRSFAAKPAGVRARVLVAGVLMNFILAYVILTVCFLFNMPPMALCAKDYPGAQFQNRVTLEAVVEGRPANQAGLKTGDRITRIADTPIECSTQVSATLKQHAGQSVPVVAERNGQALAVNVTPAPAGDVNAGRIGVAPADNYEGLDYPVWAAPLIAAQESAAISVATVAALGDVFANLFTKASVPEGVAGPVGIAKLTGDIIDNGPMVIARFIALISLSLAVFNLLPIPALDGGRLLFVGIEKLRGNKPVTPRIESAIHLAGFAFLIIFIVIITYFDVTR